MKNTTEYINLKMNILYPKNKITLKSLFIITEDIYLFYTIDRQNTNDICNEVFFILDKDNFYKLEKNYFLSNTLITKFKKNNININSIEVYNNYNNVYCKINRSYVFFHKKDKYITNLFYELYEKIF